MGADAIFSCLCIHSPCALPTRTQTTCKATTGSSLHEELSLYVQAGLSPYEALRTATVNPALYLDAERDVGKVAEGFRADLVLLTENPLEDIRHTRTRVGVMKRGRWFPASELEAALEQLAEERR